VGTLAASVFIKAASVFIKKDYAKIPSSFIFSPGMPINTGDSKG
jgi:hypothetical protein